MNTVANGNVWIPSPSEPPVRKSDIRWGVLVLAGPGIFLGFVLTRWYIFTSFPGIVPSETSVAFHEVETIYVLVLLLVLTVTITLLGVVAIYGNKIFRFLTILAASIYLGIICSTMSIIIEYTSYGRSSLQELNEVAGIEVTRYDLDEAFYPLEADGEPHTYVFGTGEETVETEITKKTEGLFTVYELELKTLNHEH